MSAQPERAVRGSVKGTWRSRAFGIEIEGDFPAPGLTAVTGPATGPTTRVDLASRHEVDERWPAQAGVRLLEERFDDAPQAARSIDHQPGQGYRLYARGFGVATVSEDGSRVVCAPPDDEPWSWQRFLVGRVLPWAAVLQGRELFHASAVTVGDAAVAFVGPTGAGKTSLAARMVLEGAGFLTDDVLALDRDDDTLRAHPGAGLLCVRPTERSAMDGADWSRLGRVLGVSGKTYVEVERVMSPSRLAAVFFLAPGDGEPRVQPISADPRLLLASTFNESLRTPERMARQLEVCADLAARVPVLRLELGGDGGSAATARVALAHARGLVA